MKAFTQLSSKWFSRMPLFVKVVPATAFSANAEHFFQLA
jgi:hypothetical protein